MRARRFIAVAVLCILAGTITACDVTPAMRNMADRSIRSLIENIPLTAQDVAGALALEYSPIPFTRIRLEVTPQSLAKRALSVDFSRFPKARGVAQFEFIGDYRLLANSRTIASGPLDLIGEGSIYFGFENGRFFIDDIPSIVLKLANRPGDCPDIDAIRPSPKQVTVGDAYTVTTTVRSKSPGHLAFLVFSNNKAVTPDQTVLKTKIGSSSFDYAATMRTRPGIAPDTYFGNVMAVEFATHNPGNLLDFDSYETLISTGITLIKLK